MKKLITIAMVAFAAVAAKADIYLYWTVDMDGSDIAGAKYAKLYASNDGTSYTSISSYYAIGSVNAAQSTIAVGGATASPYTNYLVALYNDALTEIAVSSGTYTYDSVALNTWNAAQAGTQPPSSSFSFSGFVVPEPTSGLLMMLGICALALKRKMV